MKIPAIIDRLAVIGNLPSDDEDQKLHKRLLIYMGSLMSMGGLLWGSIAFYFGLYAEGMIPYGYTILTILNFSYFAARKNFRIVKLTRF